MSLLQFFSFSFPISEVGMVLLTLLECKEDTLEIVIVIIVIISMSTILNILYGPDIVQKVFYELAC